MLASHQFRRHLFATAFAPRLGKLFSSKPLGVNVNSVFKEVDHKLSQSHIVEYLVVDNYSHLVDYLV